MVEECYDCSDDDAVAVIGRNTIRDEKDVGRNLDVVYRG